MKDKEWAPLQNMCSSIVSGLYTDTRSRMIEQSCRIEPACKVVKKERERPRDYAHQLPLHIRGREINV